MASRSMAPAIALLALAAILAGCTAPAPAPAAEAPQAKPPEAGLVPSSQAASMSQGDDPQGEFAKSLDDKFHTHNYWGGALEKTLMDADVASGAVVRQNEFGPFGWFFESVLISMNFGGIGWVPFEMPDGSIVPPEANRVEVAVSWADSPTITGLRLGFTTAAATDFQFLDPFPHGGGTVEVATTLAQNDIPHTTVSKWRFFLLPHGDQGFGVFNGTAHVTIKVYRNDTLFVAPPHKDFWGANTTLQILHNTSAIKGTNVIFPMDFASDGSSGGFVFVNPPNGSLVPPHTGVLTLTLEWKNNAPEPNPFNLRPAIIYFPSSTGRPYVPQNEVTADTKTVYTIPVDAKMVDSPYANESAWGFLVYLHSDAPTEEGFGFGSIGAFDGTFTLDVVADRETVAL